MLVKTNYTISQELLQAAVVNLPNDDFRTTLNEPTGNFFYDPWVIKPEYQNTVWSKLLASIEEPIGEARVIVLKPQMSYHVHADIDDRLHLNIQSESSYLIDLDFEKLHKLESDGVWYLMDAGRKHTASNFGRFDRVQLVVRKNLQQGNLTSPKTVKIFSNISSVDDSRFVFDSTVSPWLNRANKKRIIDNFKPSPSCVSIDIEECFIDELNAVLGENFRIEL
jgi:hypothetical protein